jgi:hypothetical protein
VADWVGRKDETLLYSHFVGKRQNLTSFFVFFGWGLGLVGAALEGDALEAAGAVFADAHDFAVVDEDVVNEAPVVAVHGVQHDGFAGGADAEGHLLDVIDEVVFADGAVVFDIDADAGCAGHVADEDAVYEVLDVVEDFAPVTDEGIGVFGEDLEGGAFGGFELFDLDGESQVAEHRVEDFASVFDGGHTDWMAREAELVQN